MSTPRRRSSRLRSPGKSSSKYTSTHLLSLAEGDEAPIQCAQSNLNFIVSSPVPPRTPATGCAKPSLEEMHPSKAHKSTTKDPDSGLRLGFVDVDKKGNDMPSGLTQQSPCKTGISSTFDFRSARPGPRLGLEAQRMMDGVREEAIQIKAKLAAEREREARIEEESGFGGRKIAQPKGKVGRFSDAHMVEFKKMDSIAGHPSAFRAQPTGARLTAAKPSLKRSQSKARLDYKEDSDDSQKTVIASKMEPLRDMLPAKRPRQNMADDTSSARPVSRCDQTSKTVPSTPIASRSQSNLLTSITTPTQASLARAATTKQLTTQIPTLSKSPSKPNLLGTPRGLTKSATVTSIPSVPRSQSKSFLKSPRNFERIKSILRYPSSSKKPSGSTSSTPSLVKSPSKPDLGKALPSIPTTPRIERSKSVKHVDFTPETINKNAATVTNSPSPFKSAIPRSMSKLNPAAKFQFPNTDQAQIKEVQYPSLAVFSNLLDNPKLVEYPSLAGVRPLPDIPHQTNSESRVPHSVPGTFTFRSDYTSQLGTSPKGFGSSPGQSSIRQVRQSIFPSSVPGSFPPRNVSNKENTTPLPSVPHGMSNKKRRRVDSDDEEEKEVQRSSKKQKQKPNVAEGAMLMAPKLVAEKMASTSKIPTAAKKKNVLSLTRLNMLARPKNRK